MFAPILTSPARPVNAARFTFLDPAAAEFYPDWDAVADQNVATCAPRSANRYDKALSDLSGCTQPAGQLERHRQRRNSTQADLSTHTGRLLTARLPRRLGMVS